MLRRHQQQEQVDDMDLSLGGVDDDVEWSLFALFPHNHASRCDSLSFALCRLGDLDPLLPSHRRIVVADCGLGLFVLQAIDRVHVAPCCWSDRLIAVGDAHADGVEVGVVLSKENIRSVFS